MSRQAHHPAPLYCAALRETYAQPEITQQIEEIAKRSLLRSLQAVYSAPMMRNCCVCREPHPVPPEWHGPYICVVCRDKRGMGGFGWMHKGLMARWQK